MTPRTPITLLIVIASGLLLTAACGKTPEANGAEPGADREAAAVAKAPVSTDKAALGRPAPAFALPDLDGKTVKLADHRGKTVVLEWYNPDCPFVKAAHNEGPLRDMAKKATARGVVWLAINSGAPGKQGHGVERNKRSLGEYGIDHSILVDEAGAVGRAYGAKTTPHMYIVDPGGVLVYMGGLDNAPLGKPKGDRHTAYTQNALDEVLAGKPVSVPDSRPWGCSVKYAN